MKKIICILLLAFCAFAAFSQETGDTIDPDTYFSEPDSAPTVPSYTFWGVGASIGFMQDKDYSSEIFDVGPKFIDPYLAWGGQWGFSRNLGLSGGLNYNVMALGKGFAFYGDWLNGCSTWAGDNSALANVLLAGTPYIIGLFPTVFYAFCGLDAELYFDYHPYYNDWVDTKIGVGISNEPSNQYDLWKASYFLQPFLSLRAQADFSTGKLIGSVFCKYSYDFRKSLDKMFDIDDAHDIYMNKVSVGAQVSFKTRTREQRRADRKAKREARKAARAEK